MTRIPGIPGKAVYVGCGCVWWRESGVRVGVRVALFLYVFKVCDSRVSKGGGGILTSSFFPSRSPMLCCYFI